MKRSVILASIALFAFLSACGGGGGEAPATVTQVAVAPAAAVPPAAVPDVAPAVTVLVAPTTVASTIPAMRTTDVTLSGVPVNVKRSTVNVGERGVNLAAFNVEFDKLSEDASIQEMVFKNVAGGNVYEMFTQWRLADESGDVCPRFSCYVQVNQTDVRVVFNYGWRPREGELKTYALQSDISPTAPSGATFAFELVGVQMRQWGKTVDGHIVGKPMGITTIVALPVVTSSQGRQTMGATPGMQYEVLNVTVTCQNTGGCLATSMQIYASNAGNLQLVGSGTLTPLIGSEGYLLQTDHFIGAGVTVTWSFVATAINSNIYAQFYDMVFRIDGRDFSPVIGNPTSECIDVSQKGGGICSFGGKG